jgi:hypothetical protein
MTAFGLISTTFNADQRTWLLDDHGTEVAPGVPVDLTLFNAAQHYPNGFIPSGTVLGKVTASGKYGPYLATAGDGRQTAVGITFNPIPVYQPGTATLYVNVAVPILCTRSSTPRRCRSRRATPPLGGYLDAAAQTALKIHHLRPGRPLTALTH